MMLGEELIAFHLIEASAQQALMARYDDSDKAWRYESTNGQKRPGILSFNGPENPVVDRVAWSNDTVWINAVKPKKSAADARVTGSVGFRGVLEEVWDFHIGGYRVCEKWLKDRKGRPLTADDITHYHRIVIALHETIRIMREIDEVIEAHGGWPEAFLGRGHEREAFGSAQS
jgi:Type ISP C-terminal specificity domain